YPKSGVERSTEHTCSLSRRSSSPLPSSWSWPWSDRCSSWRPSASESRRSRSRSSPWITRSRLGRVKQLWAPWRLEYIKSSDEEPGCVFCMAVAGDDEERLIVHRGENAIALLNKYPYSSGHFMVAPLRHIGEYGELSAEEVHELHRLSSAGMGALAQVYAPQGYNVGWNLGRIAGA